MANRVSTGYWYDHPQEW